MIDLHAHTTASDGSLPPSGLIELARAKALEALAITDHDTFAGYDSAAPLANAIGLELLCGIEMSTKYETKSVHLVGYFLTGPPSESFREWILGLQASRHARNRLLLEKLRANGIEISGEELQRRGGPLPGRPHIARLMVEKGYVASLQQAFDEYLDESAGCYISRDEPGFAETVKRIEQAGGVSSLPHPGRVSRDPEKVREIVRAMSEMGLKAIEAYHSDHSPADVVLYLDLASEFGLKVSGGSDFHGSPKPDIELGTGRDANLKIPYSILDRLRDAR